MTNKPKVFHPKPNEKGQPVEIYSPHIPSDPETWNRDDQVVTFVPDGDCPEQLNGVAFAPWANAPTTSDGWTRVAGQNPELQEPPMPRVSNDKHLAAGAVVLEPDGRVWIAHPTNGFGGYKATFCKGTVEHGLTPQATAVKEAFEESGLQVEITGFLADLPRSTSITRYYLARRVGGRPTDCGWESQAISLLPVEEIGHHATSQYDRPIIAALQRRVIA